jgi:hypothetical protein
MIEKPDRLGELTWASLDSASRARRTVEAAPLPDAVPVHPADALDVRGTAAPEARRRPPGRRHWAEEIKACRLHPHEREAVFEAGPQEAVPEPPSV